MKKTCPFCQCTVSVEKWAGWMGNLLHTWRSHCEIEGCAAPYGLGEDADSAYADMIDRCVKCSSGYLKRSLKLMWLVRGKK